ncbi:hypothetical protein IFM89_036553 [Coptis chinensis]|uniref:Cation/H+ exchanger domain-containing protein n=1 Tax=Coptis chinensis TaxID=261450 RepID=A0A835HEW4_9MAGN|nr:hypothetical protein IFM89_036553 [Coptis chinensis]
MEVSDPTSRCFPTPGIHTRGLWLNDHHPLDYALDLLFFQLPIMCITTSILNVLLKPLGHPAIISQILGGLMLGPSFLGQSKEFTRIVFPDRGKVVLETFGLFGFTIFQFLIGVKMDHNIILQSGRRAIAIGILGYIIPFTFGVLAAIVLRICVNVDTNVSRVLSIVVGTESMSAFPVITCFLSDLKILNSELGRLASSSSLISDICSVVSIVIFKISFMLKGEKAFANTLGSITSAAFLLAIAVFLVRPAALWVIKKTPEGKPVREIYLCSFIMLLLAFTFVSQITGQGYVMAPFIFGLAIPYGPPLGSAFEEKFDCFISVLLMPIFYTLCGLKTDFFTLDGNVWIVQVVILSCFIGKTIGVMLPNLYCKMPIRDAFVVALIMNSKGIVELALYNTWLEDQVFTKKIFTTMTIQIVFTTLFVSRLVQCLYNPSRRYLSYKRRTIQHSNLNTELGILACVHTQDNVPNIIQLMEISSAKKENPIHLCVLHLVELIGRSSSILVKHQRNGKASARFTQSDHIINAFRYYEQNRKDLVWVDIFSSISPFITMHDDVCSLALDKRACLIIIPFHKQWVAEGAVESSTAMRNLNYNVLEKAPCSVGILVNHRYVGSCATLMPRKVLYCVSVLFFGGADDREALSYAARMAEHPSVRLTLLRFTSKHNVYDDEKMKILDTEVLTAFKNETLHNERVWSKEEVVTDGSALMKVLRLIQNGYDLVMVGRRHVESPFTSGLTEWTEHPELGIVGDILATSDFRGVPSVLVVQQQARVWGMQYLEHAP